MDLSDRSTAQLVSESLDDVTKLVRKEAELLRIGIEETVSARLKGAGLIAGAVVLLLPGLMFIIVGATLAMPFSPHVDFLIGGTFLLIAAGVGIKIGIDRVKGKGKARSEALDKVKEDAKWAREQVKR